MQMGDTRRLDIFVKTFAAQVRYSEAGPRRTSSRKSVQSSIIKQEQESKPSYSAYHKKAGVIPDKEDRRKLAEENRKQNRFKLVMDKRNLPVVDVKVETKVDSRRNQLLKWKKEKEVVQKKTEIKKPPPFKSAGPVNNPKFIIKPSRPPLTVPYCKVSARATKVNLDNKPQVATATQASVPRVTRAKVAPAPAPTMVTRSRAQTVKTVDPQTSVKAKATNPPPIVKGMMKLNIKEREKKVNTVNTNIKATNATQSVPSTPSSIPVPKATPLRERVHNLTDSKDIIKDIENKPNAAAKKGRKPKGMQFDDIYTKFNEKFIQACLFLKSNLEIWQKVMNEDEFQAISENFRGDIETACGQAKLLMESKLPQFAELLYFYLSKQHNPDDPGPILACDLDGWWEVAIIQVNQVMDKFFKLEKLKKANWKEEVYVFTAAKTATSNESNKTEAVTKPNVFKNVKSSNGLREFLAKKRQNKGSGNSSMDTQSSQESPSNNAKREIETENLKDKNFEGGFFAITSPLKNHSVSLRSSVAKTPISLARTPLSNSLIASPLKIRNSSTPLKMLAVRRSMGPIAKIGMVLKAEQSDNNVNTNDELIEEQM